MEYHDNELVDIISDNSEEVEMYYMININI